MNTSLLERGSARFRRTAELSLHRLEKGSGLNFPQVCYCWRKPPYGVSAIRIRQQFSAGSQSGT